VPPSPSDDRPAARGGGIIGQVKRSGLATVSIEAPRRWRSRLPSPVSPRRSNQGRFLPLPRRRRSVARSRWRSAPLRHSRRSRLGSIRSNTATRCPTPRKRWRAHLLTAGMGRDMAEASTQAAWAHGTPPGHRIASRSSRRNSIRRRALCRRWDRRTPGQAVASWALGIVVARRARDANDDERYQGCANPAKDDARDRHAVARHPAI
jgi:hypothetical protein